MGTHVKLKDVREAEPWQEGKVSRSVLLPYAESPPIILFNTIQFLSPRITPQRRSIRLRTYQHHVLSSNLQPFVALSTKGTITPTSFPHTHIQFARSIIFLVDF